MIPHVPRLLLGITGSSAIVSVLPELVAARGTLVKEYVVVMTPAACRLISPLLVGSVLGTEVFTDVFATGREMPTHKTLSSNVDAALVAPATANSLSSLAYGRSNNLLTLTLANFSGRIALLPAINEVMANKPSTQRVVRQLDADGFLIAPQEENAATDLSGRAQSGASKHGLRRLLLRLAEDRGAETNEG